jgi:hypothetical protein
MKRVGAEEYLPRFFSFFIMDNWGVTEAGYALLSKSGLRKRIDDGWNDLFRDLLPLTAFVDDWQIKDAAGRGAPKERKDAVRGWKKSSPDFESDPKGFFMVSGAVTDKLLSKEEVGDPGRFGLNGVAQLDGLIAAYCISKRAENPYFAGEYFNWRTSGTATQIYGNTHGDLQIHQSRIREEDKDKLFGKMKEDHINADYSYWPVLAATALKYADEVGIVMPKAKLWKEMMRRYGWDGEYRKSSNSLVGYDNFLYEWEGMALARMPDNVDIKKSGKYFFGMMRPNADHENIFIPVIDLNEDLVFCSNYGSGEGIGLSPWGKMQQYYPRIVVGKDDAEKVFEGAVHGIMRNQSRTRPDVLAYMLWEYSMLKEGMPAEKIRRSSPVSEHVSDNRENFERFKNRK